MPAPEPFTYAAYAVITIIPILILIWYGMMYSAIGKRVFTGSEASRSA